MLSVGGEDKESIDGMTIDSLDTALFTFKGGRPRFENAGESVDLGVSLKKQEEHDWVKLPQSTLDTLSLKKGDLLYITDKRWWFGGLLSVHAKVGGVSERESLEMSEELYAQGSFPENSTLKVEKVF